MEEPKQTLEQQITSEQPPSEEKKPEPTTVLEVKPEQTETKPEEKQEEKPKEEGEKKLELSQENKDLSKYINCLINNIL